MWGGGGQIYKTVVFLNYILLPCLDALSIAAASFGGFNGRLLLNGGGGGRSDHGRGFLLCSAAHALVEIALLDDVLNHQLLALAG